MDKFTIGYLTGLFIGTVLPRIINLIINKYRGYKLLKSEVELNKTILDMKKVQADSTMSDFNRRKYEIAYNNKLERVKSKIKELEKSNYCDQMAKMVTGLLITQTADSLVENERRSGVLDELYSPKE